MPQPRERKDSPAGVSYAGAAGGLLGFAINAALGVAIAAGASDASSAWCAPFFLLALMFAPATIACVTQAPRRSGILRATVIGCLVSAIAGYVIGLPELSFILALPTVLLAQAAGLIFQGSSKR